MTERTVSATTADLRRAIAAANLEALNAVLDGLPAHEAAHTVASLAAADQQHLLALLPDSQAADLIEAMPEPQAAQLIAHMPVEEAAAIFNRLDSDEQADLMARLPDHEARAILQQMSAEEAADTQRLMEYPAESAGGLMISEFVAYFAGQTVNDVVNDLRSKSEQYQAYDVQYAYVVSATRQLVGVLRLRDLLLAAPHRRLTDIMIAAPLRVTTGASLEELERFFDRHALFGVPVVDGLNRLVGVVRRHDVEEAAEERSSRSFLKYMGILGGEELRSMPLRQRCLGRLSWLTVNIVLNIIAASVIAFHQDTLSAVIALAVFLPIISDMSGCSGNQAVAVSLRELTLGLLRPSEVWRVCLKEIAVGCVNGCVLGGMLGLVAWLWQGNLALGCVVGTALALNTVIAVILGGAVPLVLRGLRQDPALASGPILTTFTDMCGFLLVLTVAQWSLRYLLS
jgi:magnesium transporter